MSLVNRNLIVFDFETDGFNVVKGEDSITQIGAMAIDLRTLSPIEGSEFNIVICPEDIDDPNYIKKHWGAIQKHSEWMKKKPEEVRRYWKDNGIKEKNGWIKFLDYCKEYKTTKLPAPGGQNIINFDLPIVEYLCSKHGKRYPFGRIDDFDLRKIIPIWLLYSQSPPSSYSMDVLRPYFSMSSENAHDALQDVKDTAELLIRFLSLHKKLIQKVPTLNGVAHEKT